MTPGPLTHPKATPSSPFSPPNSFSFSLSLSHQYTFPFLSSMSSHLRAVCVSLTAAVTPVSRLAVFLYPCHSWPVITATPPAAPPPLDLRVTTARRYALATVFFILAYCFTLNLLLLVVVLKFHGSGSGYFFTSSSSSFSCFSSSSSSSFPFCRPPGPSLRLAVFNLQE